MFLHPFHNGRPEWRLKLGVRLELGECRELGWGVCCRATRGAWMSGVARGAWMAGAASGAWIVLGAGSLEAIGLGCTLGVQ